MEHGEHLFDYALFRTSTFFFLSAFVRCKLRQLESCRLERLTLLEFSRIKNEQLFLNKNYPFFFYLLKNDLSPRLRHCSGEHYASGGGF